MLLYYLVSGSYPVEGRTPIEIVTAHEAGTRHLLVDRRPDLPPNFIHVVERAIAPDPARRYQSAGELFEALHTLAVRPHLLRSEATHPAGPIGSPWPSRLARGAALAGAAIVALMLLGFMATRVYDKTFDVGRYSDDSLGTWLRIGLRSVVPLVAWVLMVVIGWLILRTLWQVIRTAVPPVNGLAGRVEKTVSSVLSRRKPIDRLTIARWLLLGQVVVVVVLVLNYWALLAALMKPFNTADPSVWQVLFYTSDELGPVNGYQALLPISAAAMALAWWRLIRSSGGLIALDLPIIAVGFTIVLLLFAGAAVPFRVFYDARNLHRYEIEKERCYEVGRRGDEVRVFCPDVSAGRANADGARRHSWNSAGPSGNAATVAVCACEVGTTSLEPAAHGCDAARVETKPMHAPDVTDVLDLKGISVHDDGHVARLGDARAFFIDHAELAPETASANLHGLCGDSWKGIGGAKHVDDVHGHRHVKAGSRNSSRRRSRPHADSPGSRGSRGAAGSSRRSGSPAARSATGRRWRRSSHGESRAGSSADPGTAPGRTSC